MKLSVLALFSAALLSGCGVIRCQICADPDRGSNSSKASDASPSHEHPAPFALTARGYGALDTNVTNLAQQKLMALRASELDALRTLVEQVNGVHLWSNSSVRDFVTHDDHINTLIDSYISNAKILSQDILEEGIYETVLSLDIDDKFYRMFERMPSDVLQPQQQNHKTSATMPLEPLPTQDLTQRHHDLISPAVSEEGMP